MVALALTLTMGVGLGCASGNPAPGLEGEWGSNQGFLSVDQDGGQLELPCAGAAWTGKVVPFGDGRFFVKGTAALGPIFSGAEPARFEGRVDGDQLHLKLVLPQQGNRAIELDLVEGAHPILPLCQ